jgi:CRP-like cAMP-binding protein
LKRDEVFEFLRPDQVDTLSNAAQIVELEAGDLVYERGESADFLFILLSGKVALRLPGQGGVSVLIEEVSERGTMFGSCVSFSIDSYVLRARCTEAARLLKLGTNVLKNLLDEDPRMGYTIQSKISEIYFRRYVEAMRRLQAIVTTIPLEQH